MKIVLTVTDESIRYEVEDALRECEENEWIIFPSQEAREKFIQDCVEDVIERYELYDFAYHPDYSELVWSLAEDCDYTTDKAE